MARKVRTHVQQNRPRPGLPKAETANMNHEVKLTPRNLTKQEFGKRVYTLMMKRGWTQSDLARYAGLNRDAVSTYVRGTAFPTPQNVSRLAAALGVEVDQLLPNQSMGAIDEDTPSFSMKASTNAPDKVWLQVNQLVSMSTAVRIATLLEQDHHAAD